MIALLVSLLPPVAVYNILKRSLEREQDSQHVQHTAIGWKPDDSYKPVAGRTASGEREYVRKEATK